MSRIKRQGIYKIINTTNGKYYIGRTNDLVERKCRHFSHLRKGVHHNKHLQRAFNKYGQSCFLFEILEYTNNLVEREQVYFIEYNCGNHEICYNIRDIADNIQPDETRYKRIISKFDKNNKWIETYKSIRDASSIVGVSDSTINAVLKQRKKTAGGFKWQYGDSKEFIEVFKSNKVKIKNIMCVTFDNIFVKLYETVEDIKQDFKDTRHIYEVLNNKRKTAYGYKWKFKKDEDLLNE